jgi:predicted RNase H-like HicB family nuclease
VATVYYPAIIERARKGYSVFFPDLPGCTSAGDTVSEAAVNAEEALAGHLLVSDQYGDTLAEPSDVAAIPRDPEVEEVARLLVRGERKGKAVRINITLDEGLLAAIDKVAGNRSGFLADAARVALAAKREGAGV